MRTEEEIKEKISYLKGYLEGGTIYGMSNADNRAMKAAIKELEWVLSESEGSDEV